MQQERPLLRRLVVFGLVILVLSLCGLGLLLFRWWGDRGAPPTGRLYISGDFEASGAFKTSNALVVLTRLEDGNACYETRTSNETATGKTGTGGTVCRGKSQRIWVEDALLHLSIGARGVPRVSMAGLRAHEGDWIGSLADQKRPHPRYPIRAYGVPSKAARVVQCLGDTGAKDTGTGLCLESHDRAGRLALVRSASEVEKLEYGKTYTLSGDDTLWLGLVAFEVDLEVGLDDNKTPAVVLSRVDRLKPRRGISGRATAQLGGDRRWLGRLWHVEAPDPGDEVPRRFEIHPMQRRYTAHHLSRQRTNFEGEDVLQRLIDGGWLCLDNGPDDGATVTWRPLDNPGCQTQSTKPGITRSAVEDYQRARHGDLAFIAGSLVSGANAALGEKSYLADATALPFAFDWRLAYRTSEDLKKRRPPQPVPSRLWGVRFGVTRQVRQLASFNRGLLPTVLPRDSTGRHVVQVFSGKDLLSSVYLPGATAHGAVTHGSICLGQHSKDDSPVALRKTSGRHTPLGSVAFGDDPTEGTWLPDPDATCDGCRLDLRVARAELTLEASESCGEDLRTDPKTGERIWRDTYRLRAVDRGRPWLAATDPGTRRRHFAEEFHLRAGLRPLLGDKAALSGVEAALTEYLSDAGEIGARDLDSVELTLDGDLQLTAAAIVDGLASQHITDQNDKDPDRVSVTAAILDAGSGDLLAAVNWSRSGSDRAKTGDWTEPTAWELGSGQADVLENAALLRRGAIGSTMKITGSYALVNNRVLDPGPELSTSRWNISIREAGGDDGQLLLQRDIGRTTARKCSTGPHYLPAGGQGFTAETFVRRFARSCNNFFVLSGFRHASATPARLNQSEPSRAPDQDSLLIQQRGGGAVLVQPERSEQRLVERLREGLAADFVSGSSTPNSPVPNSLYGIFFRLGFQPRFDLFAQRGEAPSEMAFSLDSDQRVVVPLVNDWFSPADGVKAPALEPGRDFAYLGIPSPGRLDKATAPTGERPAKPVVEEYDGEARKVWRRTDDGRVDVQYSMLMIGQSNVEVSAAGLAALYAPAARADGRAVSPCLFRANCGQHRATAQVLDTDHAEVLNSALHAVVSPEGTAFGGLLRIGRRDLARGWGGKTGTYQRERRDPVSMTRAQWHRLRAWACGVGGVTPPRNTRGLTAGSALGSKICEAGDAPLNPAGVQGYGSGSGADNLERIADNLERTAAKEIEVLHSFVAVAPPRRGEWPEVESPAQGIIVTVLVDRETEDEKSIAIQIAGELAAAVERWATLVR